MNTWLRQGRRRMLRCLCAVLGSHRQCPVQMWGLQTMEHILTSCPQHQAPTGTQGPLDLVNNTLGWLAWTERTVWGQTTEEEAIEWASGSVSVSATFISSGLLLWVILLMLETRSRRTKIGNRLPMAPPQLPRPPPPPAADASVWRGGEGPAILLETTFKFKVLVFFLSCVKVQLRKTCHTHHSVTLLRKVSKSPPKHVKKGM